MITHTIFYVRNQEISTLFYQKLLNLEPVLNVPGMTEFKLSEHHILGLMPESGISRLLGSSIGSPAQPHDFPKAELYFRVTDPEKMFKLATEIGGKELSPVLSRDWGNRAGYVMDQDGHVLAFSD